MDLLDTNEHDEDLRVEVFREALLSSSVPSLVTLEDDARRVQARMSRWQFGSLMLFTSRSTGRRAARHSRCLLMEGLPMVSPALQAAGTGGFGQSGRQGLVRPGELMLNDMTIPHGFAWSGSGAAYALQLTYDVLGLPPDVVRRGAERLPSTPMYDMVRAHLLRLHADADVLSTDPGVGALGSGAVERIARAWGFSTPSHFSRRFKAAYGVTPRQWRASRSLEPQEPPASLLVEGRKGDG